jgi:hypothetical protein
MINRNSRRVQGLSASLADHPQNYPATCASTRNRSSRPLAWPITGEERFEALDSPLPADPQPPGAQFLDLVDEREILVTAGVLDLVGADVENAMRCASPQAITYSASRQSLSQELRKDRALSCQSCSSAGSASDRPPPGVIRKSGSMSSGGPPKPPRSSKCRARLVGPIRRTDGERASIEALGSIHTVAFAPRITVGALRGDPQAPETGVIHPLLLCPLAKPAPLA